MTLGFVGYLLLYLVVVAVILVVMRQLIPVLDRLTGRPIVGQLFEAFLWASIEAALFIYVVITIIGCLFGRG